MTRTRLADLTSPVDLTAAIDLLDAYASDPAGGGAPLPPDVRTRLARDLPVRPGTHVLFALDGDTPVGVAICFEGYSTFAAAPLLNVHDLAVRPTHRARGLGRALLEAVVDHARRLGAKKVTLEVLEGNTTARALYASCGFVEYGLDPTWGTARLLQRPV